MRVDAEYYKSGFRIPLRGPLYRHSLKAVFPTAVAQMPFQCKLHHSWDTFYGRAMAQVVSPRPLAAEARVRSLVSPCGICGGQSGTGTGFSPYTSVFPSQFHSNRAPLHGTINKKLIIFITGLHNKPQGCGASVASAAGPFTKKRLRFTLWVEICDN
jgi:hypothetical protein